ncbi:MAG: class I SAM-dependent methyltransferase, partial [Candidatus Aureabacteria bacterium]|nr:class I SAM-dependent methyltransferase [Candidatus Auribacterota bacterium]
MENRVAENHRRYRERKETYKCFGYDIEKERQFILEKARPLNGSILEVGTGKGYFTIALAREGFCFTSVDISEDEQSFARLNLKYYGLQDQVFFLAMDASSLGFEKGSFDVIFSINMMHHLDDPYP